MGTFPLPPAVARSFFPLVEIKICRRRRRRATGFFLESGVGISVCVRWSLLQLCSDARRRRTDSGDLHKMRTRPKDIKKRKGSGTGLDNSESKEVNFHLPP